MYELYFKNDLIFLVCLARRGIINTQKIKRLKIKTSGFPHTDIQVILHLICRRRIRLRRRPCHADDMKHLGLK